MRSISSVVTPGRMAACALSRTSRPNRHAALIFAISFGVRMATAQRPYPISFLTSIHPSIRFHWQEHFCPFLGNYLLLSILAHRLSGLIYFGYYVMPPSMPSHAHSRWTKLSHDVHVRFMCATLGRKGGHGVLQPS